MSGRILIVEGIATNRIVLRSALEAAHYQVQVCAGVAEARGLIGGFCPDAVLLDIGGPASATLGFCAEVSCAAPAARPATGAAPFAGPSSSAVKALMPRGTGSVLPVPVIAMVEPGRDAARLAALRAGAVDVFDKPANLPLLQARLRSILRTRHALAELRPRSDTRLALGFAEEEDAFRAPARIVVLTARPDAIGPALSEVRAGPARRVEVHPPTADFPEADPKDPPDLFIVDTLQARLAHVPRAAIPPPRVSSSTIPVS